MPNWKTAWWIVGVLAAGPATAQVVRQYDDLQVTLEAYANATAGSAGEERGFTDAQGADDTRFDAAVRLLVRTQARDSVNWGARVVVEHLAGQDVELAESSVLLFGRQGRLELGQRPGLPDVLTGYAPNNFAFTSADFGPASGPSLDPGGTLPTTFITPGLARSIDGLSVLGATASLGDDRSTKLVYVSPKSHGWLAGVSFAPDADDPRYRQLVQAGLVKEWYWSQNVLRIGGSLSEAAGTHGYSDLVSVNVGASATLFDSISIGLAVTSNGDSGLPRTAVQRSSAAGATVSLNYNRGRWTVGGYLQRATAEGDTDRIGNDRLDVGEIGVSWRYDPHWRLYGAVYAWGFDDEAATWRNGRVLMLGLRANL
jgi:hypothetical protein